MRLSTLGYSIKQGVKSIWRNKMFSLASVATMAACIFMFSIFYSVVVNFNYMMKNVESSVNIVVYFNEETDQATIDTIGVQIASKTSLIKQIDYVSADDAWDEYITEYLNLDEGDEEAKERAKNLINPNDNPLANSAHYNVYVNRIEDQNAVVEYIKTLEGVRDVSQQQEASATLSTLNRVVGYVSIAIIQILLAGSAFLISNTVTVGVSVRKEEIGIMKLIGATNLFVRAPFLIEGMLIGLVGAAIPLLLWYMIYGRVISYAMNNFSALTNIMTFLPVNEVFRTLLPVGVLLGIGIGLIGSIFTIRRHLKV